MEEFDSMKSFISSNANAIAGAMSALVTYVFRGFIKKIEKHEKQIGQIHTRLTKLETKDEVRHSKKGE